MEKIAVEALSLPAAQRASLAHKLISSLDEDVDENAEAEWLETIERRVREVEKGRVKCQPVAVVIRRLRAKKK